jgi:tetratricopeptide (TPR) repeat protein
MSQPQPIIKPAFNVTNNTPKPPTENTVNDVFISYRRKDVDFVKRLETALRDTGRDIPPGVVGFSKEIEAGIEGANSFIAVLSPDYLQSEYCLMELRRAVELNKRLIPIVYRPIDGSPIPNGIGHINWVYFCPQAGQANTFEEAFPKVITAIEADMEHTRKHTWLQMRARDWNDKKRDPSLLLSGTDLADAETWLAVGADKNPRPTATHREYILAGVAAQRQQQQEESERQARELALQKRATRRSQYLAGVMGVFFLVAIGMILFIVDRQRQLDEAAIEDYRQQAALYAEREQYGEAVVEYGRVLDARPQDAPAYLGRGKAYSAQENYESAIADFTKALEITPEITPQSVDALSARAEAQYNLGNYPAAISDLTAALTVQPDSVALLRQRASMHRDLEDYDSALADYNAALALQPDNVDLYSERGIFYQDYLLDNQSALSDFEKILELDPNNVEGYLGRGIVRMNEGAYDEAQNDFDEALRLSPSYAFALGQRGTLYYNIAQDQTSREQYLAALELSADDLALAVQFDPEYADVYYYLGATYVASEEFALALDAYSEYIRLQYDEPSGYIARADVYSRLGQLQEAETDLDVAISLDSEVASPYISRGIVRRALGKQLEAIADFDMALNLTEDDAEWISASLERGASYADQGEYDKALEDLLSVLEEDPENHVALLTVGLVAAQQGYYERAIEYYNQVEAIVGGNSIVIEVRMDAYVALGQYTESALDYNVLIEGLGACRATPSPVGENNWIDMYESPSSDSSVINQVSIYTENIPVLQTTPVDSELAMYWLYIVEPYSNRAGWVTSDSVVVQGACMDVGLGNHENPIEAYLLSPIQNPLQANYTPNYVLESDTTLWYLEPGETKTFTFYASDGDMLAAGALALRPAFIEELTNANGLDLILTVRAPDGSIIAVNDDFMAKTDSDGVVTDVALTQTGMYTIEVRAYQPMSVGRFVVQFYLYE